MRSEVELGRRVLGAAAIALGLIGLAFGDFASVWQPVPAETPGYAMLAYTAAVMTLLIGIALQTRRGAGPAALVLAVLSVIYALCWARRLPADPTQLGVWLGVAEQGAVALGAFTVFARLRARGGVMVRGAEAAFGVCLLVFGAAHFVYVKQTAAMVPAWLPPGAVAWAYITGAGHAAAGLALISGVLDKPAARLLTLMFVAFGVFAWGPMLLAKPTDHMTLAGNAINLALIGAAWVMADAIAARRRA